MSLFRCPVCRAPLARGGRAYTCPNGHGFDLAKEGYVHLLPANQMHSKAPGDDREMAAARNRFLSGDYYDHLRDALSALAVAHTGTAPVVLDSGCGEGYYTAGVYAALDAAGKNAAVAGVDLSKFCLRWAAKREKRAEFAVASAYRLPVADGRVDLLVNCFSPLALDEFRRVLKPGGVFLYVVPAPDHLWSLKKVLYERPYENPDQAVSYDGFAYLDIVHAGRMVRVAGQAMSDLFRMTPYYWKTPRAGAERLAALDALDVEAQFRIHVFRRKEEER